MTSLVSRLRASKLRSAFVVVAALSALAPLRAGAQSVYADRVVTNAGPVLMTGSGAPTCSTGATLPVGSHYWRTDAGLTNPAEYVKLATSTTCWFPLTTSSGAGLPSNVALLDVQQSFTEDQSVAKANPMFTVRGTTDQQVTLFLTRSKTGGSYNTGWSAYIPVSNTDLRWYNGGDKMTLTAGGSMTVAGGISNSGIFAVSGTNTGFDWRANGTGSYAFGYNTGASGGSLNYFGGGTSAVFSVTNAGALRATSYPGMYTHSVVVDTGGRGDYTTISAAVAYVATQSPSPTSKWEVLVKPGSYAEDVTLSKSIAIIGSGYEVTTIAGMVTIVGGDTELANIMVAPTSGQVAGIYVVAIADQSYGYAPQLHDVYILNNQAIAGPLYALYMASGNTGGDEIRLVNSFAYARNSSASALATSILVGSDSTSGGGWLISNSHLKISSVGRSNYAYAVKNSNSGIVTVEACSLDVYHDANPKIHLDDASVFVGNFRLTNQATPGAPYLVEGTNAAGYHPDGFQSATITDTGTKVGIGTTAPGAKLDVSGTGAAAIRVISNTSGGGGASDSQLLFGNYQTNRASIGWDVSGSALNFSTEGVGTITQGDVSTGVAMTILTGGNVGIGMTAPGAKLHVAVVDAGVGTTALAGIFSRSGATPTTTERSIAIGFQDSDNQTFVGGIAGIRPNSSLNYNGGLTFYTNVGSSQSLTYGGMTEKMRIDNNGNVGIGTTAPGSKLEIYDSANNVSAYIHAISSKSATLRLQGGREWNIIANSDAGGTDIPSGFRIRDASAGQDRVTIDTSGNVGIGTTSPGATLDIRGTLSDTAGTNNLVWLGQAGGSKWAGLRVNTSADLNLDYFTGAVWGTALTVLHGSGNVGIGTTAPSYPLEVVGTVYLNKTRSDVAYTGAAMYVGGYNGLREDTSRKLNFDVYNSNSPLTAMTIQQNGNVGIGMIPVRTLDVTGTFGATSTGTFGADIMPSTAYTTNLGSPSLKLLTVNAAEAQFSTLVSSNTVATQGGRFLTAPSTVFAAAVGTGDTSISVKHNNLHGGDRIYAEANGNVEYMAVASAVTSGYSAQVLADGATGYWRLNESNGTSCVDWSGNAYDATYGGTPGYGAIGALADGTTAMTFTSAVASSDTISAPLSFTGAGTVEVWVYPTAYPVSSPVVVVSFGNWPYQTPNEYSMFFSSDNTSFVVSVAGAASAHTVSVARTLLPLNTWTLVHLVWDTTSVRLYLNGAPAGTPASAVVVGTPTYGLRIGGWNSALYRLTGAVDEVAFYPVALTPAQITNHYALRTDAGTSSPFRYAVTRNTDGTGANSWYAGDAVVAAGNYTGSTASGGWIDQYADRAMTNGGTYGWGPATAYMVRTGSAYNATAPRTVVGNLKGWYGVAADTYGLAAGDPSGRNFLVDASALHFRNGTTDLLNMGYDTSAYLNMGNVAGAGNNLLIRNDSIALYENSALMAYLYTNTGTAFMQLGPGGTGQPFTLLTPTTWTMYDGANNAAVSIGAGAATFTGLVSAAGFVSSSSTAHTAMNASGFYAYNASNALTFSALSDGSGTAGVNGLAWTTAGVVSAAGWTFSSGKMTNVTGGNTVTLEPAGTYAMLAGPTGAPTFTVTPAGVLTATGATIQSATGTGARTVLDSNGLTGYNASNVAQFSLSSSTGVATAGAGAVTLDANGIFVNPVYGGGGGVPHSGGAPTAYNFGGFSGFGGMAANSYGPYTGSVVFGLEDNRSDSSTADVSATNIRSGVTRSATTSHKACPNAGACTSGIVSTVTDSATSTLTQTNAALAFSGTFAFGGGSAITSSSNIVQTSRTVNSHALSGDVTVTKSDVGLGSVENTALSTWTGSTNIATVGDLSQRVTSLGASAGFAFDRRDSAGALWTWYATGGTSDTARLNRASVGDLFTISNGGQVSAAIGYTANGHTGVTNASCASPVVVNGGLVTGCSEPEPLSLSDQIADLRQQIAQLQALVAALSVGKAVTR